MLHRTVSFAARKLAPLRGFGERRMGRWRDSGERRRGLRRDAGEGGSGRRRRGREESIGWFRDLSERCAGFLRGIGEGRVGFIRGFGEGRVGLLRGFAKGGVGLLRDIGEGCVGLAYPPRCLGCGDRLFEARTLLCLTCFHGIDRASPRETDARLQRLPQARSALDAVSCLWIFDKGGALQAVHQALKYGNRPSYGVTLGEPVGAVYEEMCTGDMRPDIIVPIPLHRSRLLERGYNQSDMLAKGVAAVLGAPVDSNLLVRRRPTKAQTALRRDRRWENLEGAFRVVDPAGVRGLHLLLVDDVLTTGSTAGAAAKALKEAGAERVDLAAMALART